MDVSLEDLIKQKKNSPAKRKPGQQRQQPQQARRQPIGDARDRISKRRNQLLIGQDARRRIEQRKRQVIKDARQMLAGRQQQQLQLRRPAVSGLSPVPLPKKVVANDLYRQRQAAAAAPQLEYEEEDDAIAYRPQPRPRGREIPVQVTRQRRDRSRSPVRRQAPPPPPQPQPQATIVQAYKVSISNLHHGVTREDIYELFSSVGQVKKCVLLREGSAEVVYPSKEHAMAAVRRYDRRELDGLAMQLRLSVVGIKVHAAGAAAVAAAASAAAASAGSSSARRAPPAVVDERAVRAALFRGVGEGGHRSRPVNFQVSV